MRECKAVFFDVGWTLVYPRRSMWHIFGDLANAAGVRLGAEELESAIHAFIVSTRAQAISALEAGASYSDSDEEFAAQFVTLSRFVLGTAQIPGDPEALTGQFLERFWSPENWVVFPDVSAGIRRLRRAGVRVGVLSNAGTQLVEFLDYLGVAGLLDFTVVSAIEGTKKPDRRIFQCAMQRAGVAAPNAVHVGDMYIEDVLGAGRVGLRPLLMERGPQGMFPNHPESETVPAGTCEIVRDLDGVAVAIGLK